MKTFINDQQTLTSDIIIAEEFRKNSFDGISAYINVDMSKEQIPENYLIAVTAKYSNNYFEGIVFRMDQVKKVLNNPNNQNKVLSICIEQKYQHLLLSNFDFWKEKTGCQIINVTSA